MAPSTRSSYAHHQLLFQKFLYKAGLKTVYPASQLMIMSFLLHLLDSGKSSATITTYSSAIAFAHKVRGFPDPTSSFLFKKFLLGLKKSSQGSRKLDPISEIMLLELMSLVSSLKTSRYIRLLLRATMAALYYGCLRISEVALSGAQDHAVQEDQVNFKIKAPRTTPTAVRLTLLSFKHSRAPQTIEIRRTDHKTFCPVKLLWEYYQTKPPGKYFFCVDSGTAITRGFVMKWLSKLVACSSFSGRKINTHSFRIGRTTDLVLKGGVSDAYIRHVGRWSSDAYRQYIRSIVVL